EPWGGFPALLAASPGMVMNRSAVEGLSAEQLATNPPADAGAGAFAMESFRPGEHIIVRAKPDYWGDEPCFDTVKFVANGDGPLMLERIRAGETDLGLIQNPRVTAQVRDGGEVEVFSEVAG